MSEVKVWSQVRRWFRSGGGAGSRSDAGPELDARGLLDNTTDGRSTAGAQNRDRFAPWMPGRKHARAISRLEDRYAAIAGLINSIHKHLENQDERTRQMADALTQLAQSVARFPESAEAQTRQLEFIAAQLEAGNARTGRWEASFSQLSRLAESQHDTLQALGRQFDATSVCQEQMAESLGGVRDAVRSVGEASSASVNTLQGLQAAAHDRHEYLTGLLKEQGQRFARLLVVAIAVAVLAFVGMATILVLRV